MNRSSLVAVSLAADLAAHLDRAAGCGGVAGQSGPPKPPPPEVKVSRPVSELVTDYEDFPGRLVAKKAVEIRARVTGYLLGDVIYVEGTDVEKGPGVVRHRSPSVSGGARAGPGKPDSVQGPLETS